MILTVTLNAALDVTYHVDALVPHTAHRVRTVTERAGGKGINVARVLTILGEPAVATGLAGGATGTRIRRLLDAPATAATTTTAAAAGMASATPTGGDVAPPGPADGSGESVPHAFVGIDGESRRTVTVVGGGDATGFWEPGPVVTGEEWTDFLGRYRGMLAVARVVVLSGSLPPGLAPDSYARLIALAREAGVPAVLDTDGEPLRLGIEAGPDLVKPNAAELARLRGHPVNGIAEVTAAADSARDLGAKAVVASLGGDGLIALTPDGRYHARPANHIEGNPTGAGDACVAALARGLAYRQPWPARLVDAVAVSAAAVLSPVAGVVTLTDYQRHRHGVTVEEI